MASKSGGCVRRERMAKDEKWNLYGTLLHVFVRPVSQSVSQLVRVISKLHNAPRVHCTVSKQFSVPICFLSVYMYLLLPS